MFALDETIGEFVLSRPNVKIPESSTIYSFNEANVDSWDEPLRKVVAGWREGTGSSGKRFSSRYMGWMVGDVHRTLLTGGVFGYPKDVWNPELFRGPRIKRDVIKPARNLLLRPRIKTRVWNFIGHSSSKALFAITLSGYSHPRSKYGAGPFGLDSLGRLLRIGFSVGSSSIARSVLRSTSWPWGRPSTSGWSFPGSRSGWPRSPRARSGGLSENVEGYTW